MPITRRKRANPPDQPENNNHNVEQTENAAETLATAQASDGAVERDTVGAGTPTSSTEQAAPPVPSLAPLVPLIPAANGGEQQQQPPFTSSPIEGGRRTARGELFRRPPQPPPTPPVVPPVAAAPAAPLQAPTHEITLPLGNMLHLAYNPGYTGSDEARSTLLHKLANESKAGGRARCWNCGSIAIAYDRWSTRSKTFGEVGIAFCEICGVWSVL